MATVQCAFDAGGTRFEDHRVIGPGFGECLELAAEIAPLQWVHRNGWLFKEHDRWMFRLFAAG